MSRDLKTVTKTTFQPGSYSSTYSRVTEQRVDVHLPAPSAPFDVLRFEIGCAELERLVVTVHFAGPAEICPSSRDGGEGAS